MTIAQQLNITEFPFNSYDGKNQLIYSEESDNTWFKNIYDANGNIIYCEHSDGYWWKAEYDGKNTQIYFEDLTGYIRDKRFINITELTKDEFLKMFDIPVK